MSDDWTPGAGSRTLTPEAGMLFRGRYPDSPFRLHDFGEGVADLYDVEEWGDKFWWQQPEGRDGGPYDDMRPDLTDPATRYLALAQLARRVGLDSAWGCLLCYEGVEYGGWSLRVVGRRWLRLYSPEIAPSRIVGRLTHGEDFSWLVVPGINTDDALDALDRALWATRGTP
jgi:hypothetical protein